MAFRIRVLCTYVPVVFVRTYLYLPIISSTIYENIIGLTLCGYIWFSVAITSASLKFFVHF